jgi:hypothetical protein
VRHGVCGTEESVSGYFPTAMSILNKRSSDGPYTARSMGALPKRNGSGMVTQTANAGGRGGDVYLFRLLLGDELNIEVESQHILSLGFEVESQAKIRCTVANLVAYIE